MKRNDPGSFLILGILNVTPDSFSDGGLFNRPEAAVRRFQQLIAEGADQVDVGAESTRPGAEPLAPEDEWNRLSPVLSALMHLGSAARVSLDTRHDQTALKSLGLGIGRFNNVAGIYGPDTLRTLRREGGRQYIAMHMHGTPKTMQQAPLSRASVLETVNKSFAAYADGLAAAGWQSDEIHMDPGIGFGKDDGANLALISATSELADRFNLALGVSRKGFIGRILKLAPEVSRDPPSKVLEMCLAMMGAGILRTHDVAGLVNIRQVLAAAKDGDV